MRFAVYWPLMEVSPPVRQAGRGLLTRLGSRLPPVAPSRGRLIRQTLHGGPAARHCGASPAQIRERLVRDPIRGLEEIKIVQRGAVTQFFPWDSEAD
ncbi:hypothetical protein GCM10009830_16960 [Glycomyces endophyticus]|uniref:Uncharacterized protein n=1 Tax=Glycomyces endophyticus TaxID=480996 RepID=A0ABP4SE78_9ACTN